jgi:hypothetical protein
MWVKRIRPRGSIEFVGSVVLLTLLPLTATIGLVLDSNWSKALRVGLSVASYLIVLVGGVAIDRRRPEPSGAPAAWVFIMAGGVAGLVSGTARPDASIRLALVQTGGAAMLLGGFHWWAIRMWRRAYDRLVST